MENLSRIWNGIRFPWCRFRLDGGASLLVLFILLCAIEWEPVADIIRTGQSRGLFLCGAILLYQATKRELTSPLAGFLSYATFMWVLHNYQIHGSIHLFSMYAACVVGLWLAKQENLGRWISLAVAAQAALGIAEWLGYNFWGFADTWELHKPTGFFGQETLLGACLAAGLSPALFERRWWAAAPILICAYATHSSMTWASCGVVVGLWLWSVAGFVPVLSLGLMGGAVLLQLFMQDPWATMFDPQGRWEFILEAWKRVVERPIFGFGPGYWYPNAPVVQTHWVPAGVLDHVHNEWLEGLVEYGAVGMGFIALGVGHFFMRFRLTWERALVVGIMVNALGSFPLHMPSIGVIFLTAWLRSVKESAPVVSLVNPRRGYEPVSKAT